MNAKEKAHYSQIAADLRTMATRLKQFEEDGHADMEGADMPEFELADVLWSDCGTAARRLNHASDRIEAVLTKL